MSLPLSTTERGDVVVLTVGGSIDVHTAPLLRDAMGELIKDGATKLVVDLNGVDFLDSSALGALVGAAKDLTAQHGILRVACGRPRLLRIFQITRLDEVLMIADTVDDAIGLAT